VIALKQRAIQGGEATASVGSSSFEDIADKVVPIENRLGSAHYKVRGFDWDLIRADHHDQALPPHEQA